MMLTIADVDMEADTKDRRRLESRYHKVVSIL